MSNLNNVNNKNCENSIDNVIEIDEETLSRAILTFCLEGADAIMYTLLLGAQHANDIVNLLHPIVKSFLAQQQESSAQQMQLPIISEETSYETAQENIEEAVKENADNISLYKGKRSKSQQLTSTMWKHISKHHSITTLESYFNKGLKSWGYRDNNNTQTLEALHHTLAKWCVRLTHLPTWEPNALCNWFTNSGKQWIIAPHSKYWPKQLQDLAFHSHFSPPLCLWGIGNPQALIQCHNPLAIVGSRSCTDYGRELAYRFAYDCASKGHTIISGGAYGIDAAAHWGAIDAQTDAGENKPIGRTIAVFAGGLNHMGPQSNSQLFDEIIEKGGACISELCPDTTPVGHRFLLRNRIIAALSSKVLVAQARLQSGALNTATWATDLNRELYAIPGDINRPHNAGCNKIIHDSQAIMVCSQQDVDILFPQSHHYIAGALNKTTISKTTAESNSFNNSATSNKTYNIQEKQVLNSSESENYTEIQQHIINAILTCKRKCENANIDSIYENIKLSYEKEKLGTIPSIAEVSGAIALLELEGTIFRKNEDFIIKQQKVA